MHCAPLIFRSILLAVLIASVDHQPAFAQLEELTGRRVRLSLQPVPDGIVTKAAGVLTSVSPDSLTLSSNGNVRSIPRSFVQRLDVSTSLRRYTLRGAFIGTGVGAVVMGTVAVITNDSSCDSESICLALTDGMAFAIGTLPGALLGLGLGALVGDAVQSDRWKAVDLQVAALPGARSRVGVPPPGLRLVARF